MPLDHVTKRIFARIRKESVPVDLPQLHYLIADVIRICNDIRSSSHQDLVVREILDQTD